LSKLNWGQFIASYFSQVCAIGTTYPQSLIQEAVTANLKLADRIFGCEVEMSRMTFSDSGECAANPAKERYLEESFSWLIGALEGVIYRRGARKEWERLYEQGVAVFDYGMFVGRHLVQQMMRSGEFFEIYSRHSSKSNHSLSCS
jgi:hypothetical protein